MHEVYDLLYIDKIKYFIIIYSATNLHFQILQVKGKDNVGATMDSMDLERQRGITIQVKSFQFTKCLQFTSIK